MVHTLQDLKETLTQAADVRSCTKRHPWLVTGSAVAAGFVMGAVLTPSAQMTIKHSASKSDARPEPGGEGRELPQSWKSTLFSIAGAVLASILPTLVQGSIAAAVGTPKARQKVNRRRRVAQNRSGTVVRVRRGGS
jgi:hypothetical protein